jgi:phospholipase/carboxylesterase
MAPIKLPLSCRPVEGFYTSEVAAPHAWPFRTFLPRGYEPSYPYPLIVFLHGHGSSEEQILRLAPRLSRRNYICIAPRGPHVIGPDREGRMTYGWGGDSDEPLVEDYVFRAIEQTCRSYHIHTERIFLAGFREGAALAYRLGLMYPEKFGGVISLNGAMPRRGPLLRLPEVRDLKVLIGHGIANAIVPLSLARQDYRLFYAAGMPVRILTYPTTHRIHVDMLQDVDRWIQDHISDEYDILP